LRRKKEPKSDVKLQEPHPSGNVVKEPPTLKKLHRQGYRDDESSPEFSAAWV
jgi:hypothetical protein